ncbi:MAG TPA: hypothetical protein VNM92_13645 [Thermoanaerobaculia bacterium]|nr:hypothetical protein [Thermoanaerobaculia bacterium]
MADHIVKEIRSFRFKAGSTHAFSEPAQVEHEDPSLMLNLQIEYSEGDGTFYLFVSTVDGEPLSDTDHLSLDEALEQAERNYGITPDLWREPG